MQQRIEGDTCKSADESKNNCPHHKPSVPKPRTLNDSNAEEKEYDTIRGGTVKKKQLEICTQSWYTELPQHLDEVLDCGI